MDAYFDNSTIPFQLLQEKTADLSTQLEDLTRQLQIEENKLQLDTLSKEKKMSALKLAVDAKKFGPS